MANGKRYYPPLVMENTWGEEIIGEIWSKGFPPERMAVFQMSPGDALRFDYLDSEAVTISYRPVKENVASGWRL